jgi:hypothetical protein
MIGHRTACAEIIRKLRFFRIANKDFGCSVRCLQRMTCGAAKRYPLRTPRDREQAADATAANVSGATPKAFEARSRQTAIPH